jgi:hypothetical protein
LPAPRDRTQAEKYFARVSNENILPSKWSKAIGIGGWVVGSCTYISLREKEGEGGRKRALADRMNSCCGIYGALC